jgi:predicted regulator of Ras-like GTPase activity (Roadblock/LC7/MglB family)
MIEDKEGYLEKLTAMLRECFDGEGVHAVLVVGNDHTRIMGMYAINADQEQVGQLITAAASYCIEDAEKERVIN